MRNFDLSGLIIIFLVDFVFQIFSLQNSFLYIYFRDKVN